MGYPHWLIVAGAVLLMLGIVGLALRQRGGETDLNDVAADPAPPSEPEAELTQTQGADRTVKEKKRDRWAERERQLKESSNDRPKIYGDESR